jgi:hypothetical protein
MTPQPLTDSQIHAAFQARSAGSPSPDLAERIQSAARATGQQRPLVVLPGGRGIQPQRLLWAAAISATSLALVGGLILAGRQNDDQAVVPIPVPTEAPSAVPEPTPSAPASEAPAPSAEPTPSAVPSEAPAGTPDPALVVDGGAITLVGELRVRSLPTVGENSQRLEPLLPANARLLVVEGPVAADGYNWYHVMPFDSAYPSGWVAGASRDSEPWIAADEGQCPELPLEPAELAALGAFGGLACFGDQEIQLMGELECDLADVDLSITGPSWVFFDRLCTIDLGDSTMEIHDGGMPIEYGPGRSNGTITGHFADPESSSCVYGLAEPGAIDPAEITATCRAMFVGTDWTSVPID